MTATNLSKTTDIKFAEIRGRQSANKRQKQDPHFNSSVPFQVNVAEHQHIHFRAEKTIERFLGAANDWLVLVEGRVEHERDARQFVEHSYELMIERVGFAMHGL